MFQRGIVVGNTDTRSWLAGWLRRESISDTVWDAVTTLGYLSRFERKEIAASQLAGMATDLMQYEHVLKPEEATVNTAKGLLPYGDVMDLLASHGDDQGGTQGGTQRGEEVTPSEPPQMDERTSEHAQANGEYVALRAALHPRVQRFRLLLLCALLPSEIVREVQDSPRRWRQILQRDEVYGSFVVETLRDVAQRTSSDLGGYWTEDETIRFLLADEVAWRSPIRVSAGGEHDAPTSPGTIVLEVEPWMPGSTVAAFYQYQQMQMLDQRPRALSVRSLSLVRFVLTRTRWLWYEQIRGGMGSREEVVTEPLWYEGIARKRHRSALGGGERKFSWGLLMDLWNEENGQATYDSERLFRREFYRVARRVVDHLGLDRKEPHHGVGDQEITGRG